MANQWFKFYGGEYLSDPKMDRLTVQERSCWLTLLCMASQTNGVIKYISVEGLLAKSGVRFNPYDTTEWDNAQNVLKTFENYKMILIDKNGDVTIKNWNKRQDHYLTGAERVAKSRAKQKDVTMNVTNVTLEENRIEENRIEKRESSISFLKEIPQEDVDKLLARFEMTSKDLKSKAESLFLYCKSKGKVYKDYRAFLLNALKKDFKEKSHDNKIFIQGVGWRDK